MATRAKPKVRLSTLENWLESKKIRKNPNEHHECGFCNRAVEINCIDCANCQRKFCQSCRRVWKVIARFCVNCGTTGCSECYQSVFGASKDLCKSCDGHPDKA